VTPRPWTSHDAVWLATCAAPAAWIFIHHVQSSLEDVDAAMANEGWDTCVEAASEAILAVVYCRLVLNGFQGSCPRTALTLHVTESDDDDSRRLRSLPWSVNAGRGQGEQAAVVARLAADELESDLPFSLPQLRSSKGFFPSIRLGRDIEQLRGRLGLPPVDWLSWDIAT